MNFQVLLLVGDLIEGNAAPLHRADERTLARVHSQMVEKIVPLRENFTAARVVAGERACHSACLDSQIADVAESSSIGYVGLSFEKGHIERLSREALHRGMQRNAEVYSHSFYKV